MTQPQLNSWQAIHDEVLRRIHARDWPPGHVIPNEVDLAAEFGCARATVNRALRALATAGLLERRRKAGTRVALHPVSRATVDIPVIRQEVEDLGHAYGYRLIGRDVANPENWARAALGPDATPCLHTTALHTANGTPYVFEDRWINLTAVPEAARQDFDTLSANEWLLATAPYTHGDISFSAAAATPDEAAVLQTAPAGPLFVIDRTTWNHDLTVTTVRLAYPRATASTRVWAGDADNRVARPSPMPPCTRHLLRLFGRLTTVHRNACKRRPHQSGTSPACAESRHPKRLLDG